MLEIKSSNEYIVALEMYHESIKLLNALLTEMHNYFKEVGYNIIAFYDDDYSKIVVRNLDDGEINSDIIKNFSKRFQLQFIEKSKTHIKNTTIGKYDVLYYYHFRPKGGK